MSDDTLHIFVVHAPSRRGGELVSRPYRMQVANQLAAAVDSIYAINDSAKIIVAGDFNDYHDSPALEYLYQHHLINISSKAKGVMVLRLLIVGMVNGEVLTRFC